MNRLLVMRVSLKYLMGIVSISPTEAKAKEDLTKYKNCTELNKVYPGGVVKAANVKNKGGKTKFKPFVSQKLYMVNSKSDRDKDLIACEK